MTGLQGLCKERSYPFLRLYIEHCPIQEAPTDPEDILLFAKYYDPVTQTLRYSSLGLSASTN